MYELFSFDTKFLGILLRIFFTIKNFFFANKIKVYYIEIHHLLFAATLPDFRCIKLTL